ncbi:MAG: entry exclusion lipoprotein TrbK [Telluria sp.]
MMSQKNSIVAVFVLMNTLLLAGCGDRPPVASPTCADLEKITDPVQKAELLKKCPRSGPVYKPSPEKKW